jgi:predicted ATP-binding protein involved in virulence
MQIKRLCIDNHLCLVNFDICLQTINGGSSTIIIGENGSGKSTMLKAILDIILSFDMLSMRSYSIANKITYDYLFEYEYAQQEISIEKNGTEFTVFIDGNRFKGSLFTIKLILEMSQTRIFPERVIAFYSGNNDSFYDNIKKQNSQYNKKCRKIYGDYINSMIDGVEFAPVSLPKRNFLYCDESFVPIYLCAILAGNDSYEKEIIKEKCKLSRINQIDISMTIDVEALFDSSNLKDKLFSFIEYIDHRFIEVFKKGNWTFSDNKVFFTIYDLDSLHLDSISILNFFEKLKLFYKAEYAVYAESDNNNVNIDYLSEGQRQLIKVVGMLGVCKNEDCLVLMDEPDVYMNPRWKYEIKEIIDKVLETSVNTQAIIATHDPLVINGVSKEFIRIFERDNETGTTKVIEPESNTEGMGIDGLLQSEYYGLRTSYDKKTTQDFERRQTLYVKLINNEISNNEKKELRELTKKLSSLPISTNSIDFLYDDFIRVFRKMEEYRKEYLSFDEIQERNKKIQEIIHALYEGQV